MEGMGEENLSDPGEGEGKGWGEDGGREGALVTRRGGTGLGLPPPSPLPHAPFSHPANPQRPPSPPPRSSRDRGNGVKRAGEGGGGGGRCPRLGTEWGGGERSGTGWDGLGPWGRGRGTALPHPPPHLPLHYVGPRKIYSREVFFSLKCRNFLNYFFLGRPKGAGNAAGEMNEAVDAPPLGWRGGPWGSKGGVPWCGRGAWGRRRGWGGGLLGRGRLARMGGRLAGHAWEAIGAGGGRWGELGVKAWVGSWAGGGGQSPGPSYHYVSGPSNVLECFYPDYFLIFPLRPPLPFPSLPSRPSPSLRKRGVTWGGGEEVRPGGRVRAGWGGVEVVRVKCLGFLGILLLRD